MSNSTLIPPSPAEDDYARAVAVRGAAAAAAGSRSVRAVRGLAARGDGVGGQRPQRHDAVDGGRRGHARRAHGAAQGFRCAGLRLLHQFRERQGPRAAGQPQGGAVLPLEEPAPRGAGARRRRERSAPPRPTPISPAARGRRGSGRGRRTSRARCRTASPWKSASPRWACASAWARSLGRRTGPAFASRRARWSSGATDRSASTNASSSRAPATAGRRADFILEARPLYPVTAGVSPGCPLGANDAMAAARRPHTLRAQWIGGTDAAYDEAFGACRSTLKMPARRRRNQGRERE